MSSLPSLYLNSVPQVSSVLDPPPPPSISTIARIVITRTTTIGTIHIQWRRMNCHMARYGAVALCIGDHRLDGLDLVERELTVRLGLLFRPNHLLVGLDVQRLLDPLDHVDDARAACHLPTELGQKCATDFDPVVGLDV